jgi:hypothetical protein
VILDLVMLRVEHEPERFASSGKRSAGKPSQRGRALGLGGLQLRPHDVSQALEHGEWGVEHRVTRDWDSDTLAAALRHELWTYVVDAVFLIYVLDHREADALAAR